MKKSDQELFNKAFSCFVDERISAALQPLRDNPNSEYYQHSEKYDKFFQSLRELLSPAHQKLIFDLDREHSTYSAIAIEAAYRQGFKDALTFRDQAVASWMVDWHDGQHRVF